MAKIQGWEGLKIEYLQRSLEAGPILNEGIKDTPE
jgi:hypothetical protein